MIKKLLQKNCMHFLFLLFFMGLLISLPAQSKISEKTKHFKKYDGYFPFWWDAENGKLWLEVFRFGPSQEFLYINSLPAGLGSNDIGLDRGLIGGTRIVYFEKIGKKTPACTTQFRLSRQCR
jgi:hypothetical protein